MRTKLNKLLSTIIGFLLAPLVLHTINEIEREKRIWGKLRAEEEKENNAKRATG